MASGGPIRLGTHALIGALIAVSLIGDEHQSEEYNRRTKWPSLIPRVAALSSNSMSQLIVDDDDQLRRGIVINEKVAAENLRESSKYGLPSSDNLRLFENYLLSYDRRLRAPVWVLEHLTPQKLDQLDEGISRNESHFRADTSIHEYFRAQNSDFRNSGYDRGHLAAAGNHKLSQEILDQTFILSNISPQAPGFNRGGWERLEVYVRWRAKKAKSLYVVSGPLYLPLKARDGNLYVTYRVIGKSQVSVPTHFFKVLLVEPAKRSEPLAMEAFLMPNDAKLTDSIKLDDYRLDIDRLDSIERAAGVIFFDKVSRRKLDTPRSLPANFRDEPRSVLRDERRERARSPSLDR